MCHSKISEIPKGNVFSFQVIDHYFPKQWVFDLHPKRLTIAHPFWVNDNNVWEYWDNPEIKMEYDKIIKEIFSESIEMAQKGKIELNLGFKNFS